APSAVPAAFVSSPPSGVMGAPAGASPESAAPPPYAGRPAGAPGSGLPFGRSAGRGPAPRRARRTPALTDFQRELSDVLARLRRVPDDQRAHHLLGELLPLLDSIVRRMEAEFLNAGPLATLRDDLRRLRPASDRAAINDHWARALK